MAGCLGEISSR